MAASRKVPQSRRQFNDKLVRSVSHQPGSYDGTDRPFRFDASSLFAPAGGHDHTDHGGRYATSKVPQSRRQFNVKLVRSVSHQPDSYDGADGPLHIDPTCLFAPAAGSDQVGHAGRGEIKAPGSGWGSKHEVSTLNNNNDIAAKSLQSEDGTRSIPRHPRKSGDSGKQSTDMSNQTILRRPRAKEKGRGPRSATSDGESHILDGVHPVRPHYTRSASTATELTPLNMYDHKFKDAPFTKFDAFVALCSIGSYLFDVGTDVYLALLYYHHRDMWWFTLTTLFTLAPALTMTIFSLKWYIADHKFRKTEAKEVEEGYKQITGQTELPQIITAEVVSAWRWIVRVIFLMLQISPVLRYIDMLIFGWKSRNAEHAEREFWFREMVFEETDSAFLRLFECFLEAAPQLVLQLYIMSSAGSGNHILEWGPQVLSVFASWLSLSWALVNYHRALRVSIPHKAEMTKTGMVFQFIWRLFTVGARVLAIAMFASYFQMWVFVAITSHWLIMFIWIKLQYTNFCDTRSQEVFYNLIIATVCIFCFFNVKEGHTRLRCISYYGLVYFENVVMVTMWWMMTQTLSLWYHVPVLCAVCLGMPLGILIMIVYYIWFHPNNFLPDKNRHIKVWIPCDNLHCFSDPVEMIVEKEGDGNLVPFMKMPPARHSRGSICFDANEAPDIPYRGKLVLDDVKEEADILSQGSSDLNAVKKVPDTNSRRSFISNGSNGNSNIPVQATLVILSCHDYEPQSPLVTQV